MAKHRLVQHDTRPQIDMSLTDEVTGTPIDLSDAGTVIRCFLKQKGSTDLKQTLICAKLPGRVTSIDDATGAQKVSFAPPYDVAGKGGRCAIQWSPTSLDTVGAFTGEIQVTFPDATKQTVYKREEFDIRADDDQA